jgi:hypothetical protein
MPFTYAETIFIDKSVTLEGGWGAVGGGSGLIWQRSFPCDASWTTIDAGGAGRAIRVTGDIAPVIDCFTLTGGEADGLGGDPDGPDAGGGIYSASAAPIIINNVITGNYGCNSCSTYGYGGGIYLLDAPATAVVSNNLIAGNVGANNALGQGGGIMVVGGSPTIADNTILQNRAATGVVGDGGGIFVRSSTPVTIERNFIQLNCALRGTGDPALISRGGGIYFDGPYAVIRDNEI